MDAAEIQKLNVYQKMHYAAGLIESRIPKARNNQAQGFKFASHDDVVELVRPALQEARLIVTCSVIEFQTETLDSVKNGETKRTHTARGILRGTVVNVDNTAETYSVDVPFFALDSGDKAAGKGFSYAKKYIYVAAMGLSLATGEDTDMAARVKTRGRTVDGDTREEIKQLYTAIELRRIELGWAKDHAAEYARSVMGTTLAKAKPVQLGNLLAAMDKETPVNG